MRDANGGVGDATDTNVYGANDVVVTEPSYSLGLQLWPGEAAGALRMPEQLAVGDP